MVVVSPEAPEPGEAVDGVAGPEIQRVIQKPKILFKKIIIQLHILKSFNKIEKRSIYRRVHNSPPFCLFMK